MQVKDIMTAPVTTISSDTPVLEAAKLMKEKRIERLPVVDKGKLVGIVTKDRVLRASPSMATSLSLHEIHYLFARLTVDEIMQTDVVTVTPEATVESSLRLAQGKGVGCLPVLDGGRLVGILTSNDFFYQILNPLLGIGEPGARLIIRGCDTPAKMVRAVECVRDLDYEIVNGAYFPNRRGEARELMLHVHESNAERLVEALRSEGLDAELRHRD
ncbi:MAG TPA: CBS domain-containing protein [Gammaproteobacteria bacterium]